MPGLKAPSTTKPIPVPIFAVTWHTSPSLLPTHIYACSGGGGGGATGVDNFIEIVLTSPTGGESKVKIDTGDQIGVALNMFTLPGGGGKEAAETVLLAAGIDDSVTFYKIVVEKGEKEIDFELEGDNSNVNSNVNSSGNGFDVKMVGTLDLGKGFQTNTVTFDPLGGRVAVGGENGMVYICGIQMDVDNNSDSLVVEKIMELKGHIKGICKVTYHPTNPNILLSSAKDGTCRLWDLAKDQNGGENPCLDTLQCKIYDPNDVAKKKPIPKKILNPAPGQCIVKGCVFADLQGQYVFTVQSGRRGSSFLSVWRITRVPVKEPDGSDANIDGGHPADEQKQQQEQQKPPKTKLAFQEQNRIKVANYPVSAVSLSGDYSTIALGDTDGTVILLNTETFKRIKHWECVHDLPVTAIASRPLPVALAGEDKTGVAVDAITASADSKMCFLTKQRKSTLRPVKKRGKKGGGSGGLTLSFLLFMVWIILAIKVSYDVCRNEFVGLDSVEEFQNVVLECVVHTVWWAPQDRPGIAFVPT